MFAGCIIANCLLTDCQYCVYSYSTSSQMHPQILQIAPLNALDNMYVLCG